LHRSVAHGPDHRQVSRPKSDAGIVEAEIVNEGATPLEDVALRLCGILHREIALHVNVLRPCSAKREAKDRGK
jgi:hypothetical protein